MSSRYHVSSMSTVMLDIINRKYLQWFVAGRRPTILPNVLEDLILAETSSLFLLGISPLGVEILLVQQHRFCMVVGDLVTELVLWRTSK